MIGDDTAARRLVGYVGQGCSATVALDLYMVRDVGMTPEAWASIRGRSTRAVTKNIEDATEHLPDLDVEAIVGNGGAPA